MHYFWEHFHSLQDTELTVLEIGVYRGESLAVWKEIYPKARIYALDINPDCANMQILPESRSRSAPRLIRKCSIIG